MNEDESISYFNIKLCDIANTSFALGEKMSKEKPSRKILRSLPKKFDMKVTFIEKVQDLGSMKVDELIGSLQTFDINLNGRYEKKKKLIKFVPNTEENEDQGWESFLEDIALVGRNFNNSFKKLDRRWMTTVPYMVSDIIPLDIGKRMQCYECERFEHIKYECPTFIKKQKKGFSITWYESDDSSEKEIENKVMEFTRKYDSYSESSVEVI